MYVFRIWIIFISIMSYGLYTEWCNIYINRIRRYLPKNFENYIESYLDFACFEENLLSLINDAENHGGWTLNFAIFWIKTLKLSKYHYTIPLLSIKTSKLTINILITFLFEKKLIEYLNMSEKHPIIVLLLKKNIKIGIS